ncbi:unnamed protein product [Prorocentrum cordatum]|uniref:Uncharacterized protein n=1 Tax=Prorocentrum cordatum TaxID=2364126 RepID=A0ABN9X1Z4_9DINO|nr:unnamed protein product [Polarella glacialis]
MFYQERVTPERAATNVLGPALRVDHLHKSLGVDPVRLHSAAAESRPGRLGRRAYLGDRFLLEPAGSDAGPRASGFVHGALASNPMGDHTAVDVTQGGHLNLLRSYGLLAPENFIDGRAPFPRGDVVEGLCIDDYLVIGRHAYPPGESRRDLELFDRAGRLAYVDSSLSGSSSKEVRDAERFVVVGAEVDSSARMVEQGYVPVGAPVERRLPLAELCLRAAQLPRAPVALVDTLVGSLGAVFAYRRPLFVCLNHVYSFVAQDRTVDHVIPRAVKDELGLASVLSIAAETDLTVPFSDVIYATDASPSFGAICTLGVSHALSSADWRCGERRGGYSRLDSRACGVLRSAGALPHSMESAQCVESDLPTYVRRGIAMVFDFIEFAGGSGVLTRYLASQGVLVGPVIDISYSRHYDLSSCRLMEWAAWMLYEGRILTFAAEPPCTTFSPAAHPAVRSCRQPIGFNRSDPKTRLGNLLAFRCMLLMLVGLRVEAPGGLEQPRLSKMAWLQEWSRLLALGAAETWFASCAYHDPALDGAVVYRKEFRWMTAGFPEFTEMAARCPNTRRHRAHTHAIIEGAATKYTATYTRGVVVALGARYLEAIRRRREVGDSMRPPVGSERLVINELLMSGSWEELRRWAWRSPGHINILESNVVVNLLEGLVRNGGDRRFAALIDSRVTLCSQAKGRSSSRALTRPLEKSCALQIAGSLYPSYSFAPSRLNVADDPTRHQAVRAACRPRPDWLEHADLLDWLLTRLPTAKACAAWLRLVCLLLGSSGLRAPRTALAEGRRLPPAPALCGVPGQGSGGGRWTASGVTRVPVKSEKSEFAPVFHRAGLLHH